MLIRLACRFPARSTVEFLKALIQPARAWYSSSWTMAFSILSRYLLSAQLRFFGSWGGSSTVSARRISTSGGSGVSSPVGESSSDFTVA